MNEPKTLKSKKPEPDTQSWYEYIWKAEQETPNRLEDAAKFLAAIISTSLTLFLAIGKAGFEKYQSDILIKVSVIIWLLALVLSFLVLLPWCYQYNSESVQSIKKMNRKVVRVKDILLGGGVLLYLSGLVLLSIKFLW